MPGSINGSKGQSFRTARLPSDLPIHMPFPKSLAYKLLLAAPFQRECPSFVPDPITDPVVRTDVYENFDAPFEKGGDMVFGDGGMQFVLGGVEAVNYVLVA